MKDSSEFRVPSSESTVRSSEFRVSSSASSEQARLTPDLAGNTHAESGASELPAPALPSGAEIILPGSKLSPLAGTNAGSACAPAAFSNDLETLTEQAREQAQMAADLIWAGNFHTARAALQRALELTTEAEQAAQTIET